ncbi:MAG: T9SS type A sorting domain-containing protein [Dysgonamonadaceae bacterium]|jgi:hypothetical protein|nr:T9SS type A sorting domain-containing protein [Dysgonamonadaceae bacterium]
MKNTITLIMALCLFTNFLAAQTERDSKTVGDYPPSITGPDYICANTTFTIQNLPAGVSPSWTVSSDLVIISASGNSVLVGSSSYTNFGQWVKASYEVQGTSKFIQKDVAIWKSGIQSLKIGKAIMQGDPESYGGEIGLYRPLSGGIPLTGSNFIWSTSAINWIPEFQGYYFTIFDGTACGQIEVSVNFTDVCGANSTIYKNFDIECSPYFTCYPNPASNILTIAIDQTAIALNQQFSGKLQKSPFDVRLYDNQGNWLQRASSSGENVNFNTSGLLNGIYFVHIYDGINAKPEIRKIIVKH